MRCLRGLRQRLPDMARPALTATSQFTTRSIAIPLAFSHLERSFSPLLSRYLSTTTTSPFSSCLSTTTTTFSRYLSTTTTPTFDELCTDTLNCIAEFIEEIPDYIPDIPEEFDVSDFRIFAHLLD